MNSAARQRDNVRHSLTSAFTASFRWGRSLLFCPGDRPDRFARAAASGADTVVLDLEDAVDPANKAVARRSVADYLTKNPGLSAAVRCNVVGSEEFKRDMEAFADVQVSALVAPKVTLSGGTQTVLRDSFAGRPAPAICATIETARGVMELRSLAEENEVFDALSWGPHDLAADMGVRDAYRRGGGFVEPLAHVRSELVIVAAAGGLAPLDTVTAQFDDTRAVARDARKAASLGFVGKFAIHPLQIQTINQYLRPDANELRWARKIVSVAERNGSGAAALDGQMLDEAMYRRARNTLFAVGLRLNPSTDPT